MSCWNREPYFWHFNRKILFAAAPGLGKARSCWCNHVPETSEQWIVSSKHYCSQFYILVYLCLVQKMKSWPHWCQWQKLERVVAGQVFAQSPQSHSPGVTFVLFPSPGLTPSSNGFLLKELVNSVILPPLDRLVLSAPIEWNNMHRNMLKSLHKGWTRAGNKDWLLPPGPFLLLVCHDLLQLRS